MEDFINSLKERVEKGGISQIDQLNLIMEFTMKMKQDLQTKKVIDSTAPQDVEIGASSEKQAANGGVPSNSEGTSSLKQPEETAVETTNITRLSADTVDPVPTESVTSESTNPVGPKDMPISTNVEKTNKEVNINKGSSITMEEVDSGSRKVEGKTVPTRKFKRLSPELMNKLMNAEDRRSAIIERKYKQLSSKTKKTQSIPSDQLAKDPTSNIESESSLVNSKKRKEPSSETSDSKVSSACTSSTSLGLVKNNVILMGDASSKDQGACADGGECASKLTAGNSSSSPNFRVVTNTENTSPKNITILNRESEIISAQGHSVQGVVIPSETKTTISSSQDIIEKDRNLIEGSDKIISKKGNSNIHTPPSIGTAIPMIITTPATDTDPTEPLSPTSTSPQESLPERDMQTTRIINRDDIVPDSNITSSSTDPVDRIIPKVTNQIILSSNKVINNIQPPATIMGVGERNDNVIETTGINDLKEKGVIPKTNSQLLSEKQQQFRLATIAARKHKTAQPIKKPDTNMSSDESISSKTSKIKSTADKASKKNRKRGVSKIRSDIGGAPTSDGDRPTTRRSKRIRKEIPDKSNLNNDHNPKTKSKGKEDGKEGPMDKKNTSTRNSSTNKSKTTKTSKGEEVEEVELSDDHSSISLAPTASSYNPSARSTSSETVTDISPKKKLYNGNKQNKSTKSSRKPVEVQKGISKTVLYPCELCEDRQMFPASKIYEHIQTIHEGKEIKKNSAELRRSKAKNHARWRYKDLYTKEVARGYFPPTNKGPFCLFDVFRPYLEDMDGRALSDLTRITNKLLALLEAGTPTDIKFDELGEEGEEKGLFDKFATSGIRKHIRMELLCVAKAVRKALSKEKYVKTVKSFKKSLEEHQAWLDKATPYEEPTEYTEQEVKDFIEMQVNLFMKLYDAREKIKDNWQMRFPRMEPPAAA